MIHFIIRVCHSNGCRRGSIDCPSNEIVSIETRFMALLERDEIEIHHGTWMDRFSSKRGAEQLFDRMDRRSACSVWGHRNSS
jgi:hypothetical protein